ncbi:MAG: HIG1 domain-containing protein [Alphaproteobacteria bacterium]|nr:HIG1 domain-containing protein [Alphaproteobacteria bacterium]
MPQAPLHRPRPPADSPPERTFMAGTVLILLALGAVALILFAGIAVMAIGGKTSARWSNVLMRYRILAQAIALLIIAVVVYLANRG